MKDSPKERAVQDRERLAREKVFEQLIDYALTEGLTIDQLESMDKSSILHFIKERKKQKGSH